jgi:transposase
VLKTLVHPAHLSDSEGGQQLWSSLHGAFVRISLLWEGYKASFIKWVEQTLNWTVVVVQVPQPPRGDTGQAIRDLLGDEEFERRWPKGFHVLPWRWIVERTLAWISKNRRLSKDYELPSDTTETWIYLSMSRLMLRRLASLHT